MATTRAQGVIIVRFPPPVPKDFGRALKAAVLDRLGPDDECSTSNTGASGGPPGWACDIRIQKPKDTPAATAVADCLAALATTMEVSERRGPVDVPLEGGGWDTGLQFTDGTDAWADLYLTLPASFGERDAVVTAVSDAVAPHGTVTHAVKLPALNLTVRVEDARRAPTCVARLAGRLAGVKVSACTQSRPVVTAIGGR